jgi:Fe-S cluster biogenesis protein NfuA
VDAQAARGRLEAGLNDIRESIQADHADLEVIGLDGSTARVRLVITPDTCRECIVSKSILESIMLESLRDTMPEVSAVELEDPRVAVT